MQSSTPQLHLVQVLLPVCINPLHPLLPIRVHFSCCSPLVSASAAAHCLRPLQLLLPACVRFSCCSPLVPASAAAHCLHPLQLLLAAYVHFSCCSMIASASTAACHLHSLQLLLRDCIPAVLEDSSPCPGPVFSNLLHGVRG